MAEEKTAVAEKADTQVYELLALIPNKYTEEEVPQIHKKLNELIVAQNGEVKKEINYGKRRLAYPIKHNHYGYYLLTHFTAEAPVIKELTQVLGVQDELLRFLITHALPEGSIPEEAGDLRQVERVEPKKEEAPVSKKKPSIADAKASDVEKKKMAKGSVFDLEKELGVTAAEAEKALEEDGKDKSKKDDSVDMAGLESKLDEIVGDISKDEESK